MSDSLFRFVHAADFGLEIPIGGLAEVPEHLRDLLVDAPYRSARRVFETAVREEADFVVLAGGLLDPQTAGPAAIAFLLEQFRWMSEKGIAVYWAGGRTDSPSRWPASLKPPECVRVFSEENVEAAAHRRDDETVAVLLGRSGQSDRVAAADFCGFAKGCFAVAAASGRAEGRELRSREVGYWALGGSVRRRALDASPSTAIYPGRPQARRVEEAGGGGCVLVDVDGEGRVRTRTIATEAARWRRERIVLADDATRDDLELLLADRAEQLAAALERDAGCQLVVWSVAGGGSMAADLRSGRGAAELLGQLRSQFGQGDGPVWSVSIEPEVPESWSSPLREEETIRGEFLRTADQWRAGGEPIDLTACLPQPCRRQALARAASLRHAASRERVLRKAEALGVDLLSGPGPEGKPPAAR